MKFATGRCVKILMMDLSVGIRTKRGGAFGEHISKWIVSLYWGSQISPVWNVKLDSLPLVNPCHVEFRHVRLLCRKWGGEEVGREATHTIHLWY